AAHALGEIGDVFEVAALTLHRVLTFLDDRRFVLRIDPGGNPGDPDHRRGNQHCFSHFTLLTRPGNDSRAGRRPFSKSREDQSSPSSSRASSLIRSWVQGGVHTTLTLASLMPSTCFTAFSTSPGSAIAAGQAGVVSVIST